VHVEVSEEGLTQRVAVGTWHARRRGRLLSGLGVGGPRLLPRVQVARRREQHPGEEQGGGSSHGRHLSRGLGSRRGVADAESVPSQPEIRSPSPAAECPIRPRLSAHGDE
jgi:hypothetical protein